MEHIIIQNLCAGLLEYQVTTLIGSKTINVATMGGE